MLLFVLGMIEWRLSLLNWPPHSSCGLRVVIVEAFIFCFLSINKENDRIGPILSFNLRWLKSFIYLILNCITPCGFVINAARSLDDVRHLRNSQTHLYRKIYLLIRYIKYRIIWTWFSYIFAVYTIKIFKIMNK